MRLLFILSALLFLGSCQKVKNVDAANTSTVSVINPNGDSELALLMREMYDHGMKMKKALKNGEAAVAERDFAEILTAAATEPDKAASSEFKAFGQSYIEILRQLESATPEDSRQLYDAMVDNCMACHTTFCPGPKMRIKHLIIRD